MQRKHGTNHADWYFFTCITKNRLGVDKCTGMYVREEDVLRAIYYQLKLYVKEHFISDSQYKQELMRLNNKIDQSDSQYQEAFRNAVRHYERFVDGEISKDEFAKRIEEDTLLEVLNKVPVHKGDVFFIEAGTIHAIGKGLIIAEIQQNSNVTYRVYDYGRVGKDGKKRELHIEKAVAVTNCAPAKKDDSHYPHIADCDYFTVDKLNLDGTTFNKLEGTVSEKSFLSILVLDGEGTITSNGESVSYKKGDSIFLTAGSGEYSIEGVCDALLTTIRE